VRILLADDHTLIRENLTEYLINLELDISVLEAGTFAEAFEIASQTPDLDLIILDLKMPGMDGLDGLRSMLDQYPKIPIVMLSGTARKSDILDAMKMGAKGFIPKTISRDAMNNALRLVLAGDTYIPSGALAELQENDGAGDSEDSPLASLTKRELEVLDLLIEGHPNKQIAREMDLKEITVKVHLQNIYKKFGVSNRTHAVSLALKFSNNS